MICKNRSSVFRFFVTLIVLLSVLSCTVIVFAQSSSTAGEILELLKKGSSGEKSLGSYLWNQTSGSYTNLGDFAAGELINFLRKEVEQNFTLNGKQANIKIVGLGDLSGDNISVAEFGVELKQDDITEYGTLKVNREAIKEYVNKDLFPQMKSQLSGSVSESVPLVKDLVNLLAGSLISGNTIIPNMNTVWNKLISSMDSYPALKSIMDSYPALKSILSTPSDVPLMTITTDETAETQYLTEIFDNIRSSEKLVETFKTLEVNPTPEVELDTDPEPGPQPQPEPERHTFYILPLLDEKLPATGFSASHITTLAERPRGLSYEGTGYTLLIPGLDVAETIMTVPVTDGGYPVEWLGRNVGLLEGSGFPGEGIVVLTGHNHLNTMDAGPFLFIGTLEQDDRLFITNADNEILSYRVYANNKIPADGFASIAGGLCENALVLITCEDESIDGGYLNRRVIFAEPL